MLGSGREWLPYLISPLAVSHAGCIVFQILSERGGVSEDSPCSLDPISPEDLPRQGMGREVFALQQWAALVQVGVV